ncbi:MAG: Fe-S-containing hydro-lyase [Firmicutes bacterium]|nr:Fe-S-containing hydro-lyase [Bacillota bacterium]
MEKKITAPLTEEQSRALRCGDNVLISGVIYTGRDAAHKRLCELLEAGKELPVDLKDAIIYYVGPAPAQPGQVIGSAGPTTSYRMDAYAPALLDIGLKGMIGKGKRSPEVVESMKKNGGVYFGAIGGCGALLAKCIKKAEVVAYEDLGAEAIRRLEVEDLPATVIIDSEGNNLYEQGRSEYLALAAEK